MLFNKVIVSIVTDLATGLVTNLVNLISCFGFDMAGKHISNRVPLSYSHELEPGFMSSILCIVHGSSQLVTALDSTVDFLGVS